MPENQRKNYISGVFWALKSNFQVIDAVTYIPLPLTHQFLQLFLFFLFLVRLLSFNLLALKHILKWALLHRVTTHNHRQTTLGVHRCGWFDGGSGWQSVIVQFFWVVVDGCGWWWALVGGLLVGVGVSMV